MTERYFGRLGWPAIAFVVLLMTAVGIGTALVLSVTSSGSPAGSLDQNPLVIALSLTLLAAVLLLAALWKLGRSRHVQLTAEGICFHGIDHQVRLPWQEVEAVERRPCRARFTGAFTAYRVRNAGCSRFFGDSGGAFEEWLPEEVRIGADGRCWYEVRRAAALRDAIICRAGLQPQGDDRWLRNPQAPPSQPPSPTDASPPRSGSTFRTPILVATAVLGLALLRFLRHRTLSSGDLTATGAALLLILAAIVARAVTRANDLPFPRLEGGPADYADSLLGNELATWRAVPPRWHRLVALGVNLVMIGGTLVGMALLYETRSLWAMLLLVVPALLLWSFRRGHGVSREYHLTDQGLWFRTLAALTGIPNSPLRRLLLWSEVERLQASGEQLVVHARQPAGGGLLTLPQWLLQRLRRTVIRVPHDRSEIGEAVERLLT